MYNAVDGCKVLGIDGEQMDIVWAGAKKAGNLVKFGGGFYAGKIPVPDKSAASSGGILGKISSAFGFGGSKQQAQ